MAKLKILTEPELRKKYTGDKASNLISYYDNSLRLPSRCLWLNWQLGGGTPYGKILEIFGYESTGKSLLALDFAYTTQALGGIVLWADIEDCFDSRWAKENGLDPERIELYLGNDIEGFSDWARDMILFYRSKLIHNEPILLVCDSIAALECLDNINSDQLNSKAEMGNRAKIIYRMYRTRNKLFSQYGVSIIMINQVRKKVGASMFEASETTPGGDATKFFASQRLALIRSTQIKGLIKEGEFIEDKSNGIKIGQNVIVRVEKNKTSFPKHSVKTEVYFLPTKSGYVGFSRYMGFDEILLEHKIIIKQGNSYVYKKKKETITLCVGRDNILKEIEKNEDARAFFIRKLDINTISKTREKLAALKINLYKIK